MRTNFEVSIHARTRNKTWTRHMMVTARVGMACSAFAEFLSQPRGITAEVEDGNDFSSFRVFPVIDAKRKSRGDHSVVTKVHSVDTMKVAEGFDIEPNSGFEVVS